MTHIGLVLACLLPLGLCWYLLRLPVDHVLVPGGRGVSALRPLLGSDHFGVLLRFDL